MTGWKLALGATVPAREGAVRVASMGRILVRNECIFEMVDSTEMGRREEEVERETVEIWLGITYYIDISRIES